MAESPKETKKDQILKLYHGAPALTNQQIADFTKSSPNYVRKIVNPLRAQRKQARKYKVGSKIRKQHQKLVLSLKASQMIFSQNFLPQKTYSAEKPVLTQQREDFRGDFGGPFKEDFEFFLPTDDLMGNQGTGTDLGGSWSQYQYLAEKRIGLGPKICKMPAEDAVLEGFKLLDKKTREVVPFTKVPNKYDTSLNLEEWQENTDFLNFLAQVIYYERVYGCGFIVSYFSKDDKARGILNTQVKESEGYIKAFDAIAPTQASPQDAWSSLKLDKDPQRWSLFGGQTEPQNIHFSRVRVFMSRPVLTRWYGLSIFEPIWHSIIPYYQALIFLLRAFNKYGNTMVKYLIDSEEDLDDIIDAYSDLIEDMKMNGTLIGKLGSEIGFEPTNLAKGLRDLMEVWIEDVSAGTRIPVPIMMGRIVSSGLSGVGYLVAERYYMKLVKSIQLAFTDDVRALIELAGFDISKYIIDWNLSITKTDQQRLMDETMEVELELLKEQLMQQKLMTDQMIAQSLNPQPEQQEENPNLSLPNAPKNPAKTPSKTPLDARAFQIAKDLIDTDLLEQIRARREELQKQLNLPLHYRGDHA